MSFNIQLWGIENGLLSELPKVRLDTEDRLEQWIAEDVSLLGLDLLIIGRQVRTSSGGRIDLLAIDEKGDLVILELKRDRTPREVIAQALDYASWVDRLLPPQIAELSMEYLKQPLVDAFSKTFETPLPEVVNNDHRIVIVASELDDSSERIVQYLANRRSMNINVVFFSCFRQGENELVGRAWLQDPEEIEERPSGTIKSCSTFRTRQKTQDKMATTSTTANGSLVSSGTRSSRETSSKDLMGRFQVRTSSVNFEINVLWIFFAVSSMYRNEVRTNVDTIPFRTRWSCWKFGNQLHTQV